MIEYALLTFGSLFAIVDPFAAIPAFLAMTARDTQQARARMARTACTVCAMVMMVFSALGPAIFKMFGIKLPAFQIAGGLVLLLSALDMLRAKRSPMKESAEELEEGMSKDDIAITPLAIPMLSGPGAITTAIVLAGKAEGWQHRLIFYATIPVVALLTYFILTISARASKQISPSILNIITRLMGLLLAAIGVQFILTALKIG